MRTWKDKLTSRKFWAAVVGVVISIMVLFGSSDEEQNKVTAIIGATSSADGIWYEVTGDTSLTFNAGGGGVALKQIIGIKY